MENQSSFDRLVITLSPAERAAMLEKVQAIISPKENSLVSVEMQAGKGVQDIELQLKSESFFVRLWLRIKAMFSNTDIKTLYNAQLLLKRGKEIERKEPGLIDTHNRLFLQVFHDQVEQLSQCVAFFKSGIEAYESDPGGFYVFLSSLIAPEINKKIAEDINPTLLPFSREVTSELRLSMIRNLDSVLQGMPAIKRAGLYSAVCNTEWIAQLVRLPYERVLASFSKNGEFLSCPFDSIKNEVSQFAKVLCHGKAIQTEVLEALFVFSSNVVGSDNKEDFDKQLAVFMEKAAASISLIKMFINTVPLKAIGSIVWFDSFWYPAQPEGGEDWFVKYKSSWRKNFDRQWDIWIAERKKNIAEEAMKEHFGFKSLPLLPDRPWTRILGGVSFKYDYVLGFLSAFYENVYTEYGRLLKILMVEGVFYQKDNLVELTDAVAELDKQKVGMMQMKNALAPEGNTGEMFAKLLKENLLNPRNKDKLDSIIKSLESDAAVITTQWCASARTIELVLRGVLLGSRNSRYDTISNLSTIQAGHNEEFRDKLEKMRNGFEKALEIIKDLETIG